MGQWDVVGEMHATYHWTGCRCQTRSCPVNPAENQSPWTQNWTCWAKN